jgi:TrmH family RNA methyltransferase
MLPDVPASDRVISSRQNALVAQFRRAARGEDRGLILLDGPHLLAEALGSGVTIEVAAFDHEAVSAPELAGLAGRVPTGGLALVTSGVLAAMSPARTPSGVVALARRLDGAPEVVVMGVPPLVVVAVDVQDPGNLGAMIRSADAGGATGFITTASGADPFGWKALRGAMGSAFRLPIARVADADAAVAMVRDAGLRVAATVRSEGTSMLDADFAGPIALLLGAEGHGLADSLVSRADVRITIPMAVAVDSLNVAVATALLVYEARRQRPGG